MDTLQARTTHTSEKSQISSIQSVVFSILCTKKDSVCGRGIHTGLRQERALQTLQRGLEQGERHTHSRMYTTESRSVVSLAFV